MNSGATRLSVCSVVSAPPAQLDSWLRHVRGFADEIVLSVDVASHPDTVAVAREHADSVALVELDGLPNRAYGWTAERANGDWILHLDDDEVIGTQLEGALPSLLEERVTHFHLPVRWVVRDSAGGPLAWLHQFPWFPNHATRLFRNLRGCFRHPAQLHAVWQVEGEGRALAPDEGSIYHLDLALKDRGAREAKRERYHAVSAPGVPTCEEYYLYEDYAAGLRLTPVDATEEAVSTVLESAGQRLSPSHGGDALLPVTSAVELHAHAADRSPDPPIWSAEYLEHDTPAELGTNRGHAVRLRVRNTSLATWRSVGSVVGRVVLSYRWRRPDDRSLVVPQGDISLLPAALAPGEEAELIAGLWTPSEPGRYLLEWDALCERVAWFSDRGVAPLSLEVEVVDRGERPRAPHFPAPPEAVPSI